MPYLIYTIGGKPVTGKSTLAKTLAQQLGYDRIYVGGILREWSRQPEHNPKNFPFDEWYRSLHNDSTLDNKADRTVGEAARIRNDLVLEGRVAFHFVPPTKRAITCNVYLTCDQHVAAERIFDLQRNTARPEEIQYRCPNHAYKVLTQRFNDEVTGYKALYGIDISNESHYDLIIDTTTLGKTDVLSRVLSFKK